MFYSICYDIRDDHRRLKVAKALKDFGERVQFSVFEANLDPEQLQRLRHRLTPLLDMDEDTLRIYPLCASCLPRVQILGAGKVTQDPEVIIL